MFHAASSKCIVVGSKYVNFTEQLSQHKELRKSLVAHD